MISRAPALALEWHLRALGKLQNARVNTEETESGYRITAWAVTGVSQPTDAEVETIINQYTAARDTDAAARRTRKLALAAKLGLAAGEVRALRELIEDKGDLNA